MVMSNHRAVHNLKILQSRSIISNAFQKPSKFMNLINIIFHYSDKWQLFNRFLIKDRKFSDHFSMQVPVIYAEGKLNIKESTKMNCLK